MIIPSQRPLPDNTQHSQQTNIQALGGIRTHNRSRRAAVNLRLRPRSHWDRHAVIYKQELTLKVRLNGKILGCAKIIKTPRMTGLLCAVLKVLNYSLYLISADDKIVILYALDLSYIR